MTSIDELGKRERNKIDKKRKNADEILGIGSQGGPAHGVDSEQSRDPSINVKPEEGTGKNYVYTGGDGNFKGWEKLKEGAKKAGKAAWDIGQINPFPDPDHKHHDSSVPGFFWDKLSEGFTWLWNQFYYTWWIIDEGDFTELSESNSYPRNRSSLKPFYQDIPLKALDRALANEKGTGKVIGQFLGRKGWVGRNDLFEDHVPMKAVKKLLGKDKVIVLGAARRNLLRIRLRNFDPEKLLWNWTMWGGDKIGIKTGTVHVKVISEGDLKKFEDVDPKKLTEAQAKTIFEDNEIGISNAEIFFKKGAEFGVANKTTSEHGKAEFAGVPLERLGDIGAKATGYVTKSKQSFRKEGITLSDSHPEEYAIVILKKKGASTPRGKSKKDKLEGKPIEEMTDKELAAATKKLLNKTMISVGGKDKFDWREPDEIGLLDLTIAVGAQMIERVGETSPKGIKIVSVVRQFVSLKQAISQGQGRDVHKSQYGTWVRSMVEEFEGK